MAHTGCDPGCDRTYSTAPHILNGNMHLHFFFVDWLYYTNQKCRGWIFFFFCYDVHFENLNCLFITGIIDLIQKSANQQGQKWQLFFHFRFSAIILSVLLQQ
jgi:hypothetical protein